MGIRPLDEVDQEGGVLLFWDILQLELIDNHVEVDLTKWHVILSAKTSGCDSALVVVSGMGMDGIDAVGQVQVLEEMVDLLGLGPFQDLVRLIPHLDSDNIGCDSVKVLSPELEAINV